MNRSGNWQRDVLHIILYAGGVWLAITAVPHVVMEATGLVLGPIDGYVKGYAPYVRYLWLAESTAQLVVGLAIVRKSAGLAQRAFPDATEPVKEDAAETSVV